MKTPQIFLFALLGCTSFVFSQSYSGVLTHTNSYFTMEPFNGSYDDGSAARIFYDGNNKRIRFWNTDSGTSFTHIDVGNVYATGNIIATGNVGIGTTSPTSKLVVNGSGMKLGGSFTQTNLRIEAADESGAPAKTVGLELRGYEGRGKGIYITDKNTSHKWFIGEGYAYEGIGIGYSTTSQMEYSANAKFFVGTSGNVGIGTTAPDDKLTVKGRIHAEEVKVDLSVPGPDYVFKEGYDLKSLKEVQEYIRENGHLPNIPSAAEMEENGVELGIMNMKLLEKIEELTLYQIQLLESLEASHTEIRELKKRIENLESK